MIETTRKRYMKGCHMAYKRVTMQDIADACGLSRNTVSKIFNDRGAVPEATRSMVYQKARELGYLQGLEAAPTAAEATGKSIALLACHLPSDFHFCTFFVPAFAEQLGHYGYTLMVHKITPEELRLRVPPARLNLEQTAGILCIEVFDKEYMDMVCGLGLPTVFVDAYAEATLGLLRCDFLSMENVSSVLSVTDHLIGQGARRLGFVGDATHCNSFWERWESFKSAMARAGLEIDPGQCILDDDIEPFTDADWLYEQLQKMPALPDAFVCANDLLAIRLMTALKRMGVRIPEDVMVAGFDGQPQSAVVEPALTTVRIPSAEIGRLAASMLYLRISDPRVPYLYMYAKTEPIYRASTDRKGAGK